MLHAFLYIFMCDMHREWSLSPLMVGAVHSCGHHTAWVDAMKALQDRLSIHVTWHFDCGIRNSIYQEMIKTEHQFSQEQFERWGVAYATVKTVKQKYTKKGEQVQFHRISNRHRY